MSAVKVRFRKNEAGQTVVSVDGRFVCASVCDHNELRRIVAAVLDDMAIENVEVEAK